MNLVAGSSDGSLFSFEVKPQKHSTETLTLLHRFNCHDGTIESVAVAGTFAVSGGYDNTIGVYDVSASSEIGSLKDSTSTVTSLSFFTPPPSLSYKFPRDLFSAMDDGNFSFYEVGSFVQLKTVKVHKKGVNDMSVHPSGKLALTVGRDSCLAMVNLVRGRRSFYCSLGKEASVVKFNCSGDKFFMAMDEKLSVHQAEDARLLIQFESKKKIVCACAMNINDDGVVISGGEDNNLTAWDIVSGKVAYSIEEAHSRRVKGVAVVSPLMVASASSNGIIRVWDVRMATKKTPLAEADTESRLTCFAAGSL